MPKRAIYIWKLQPIINAEGSVDKIVEKASRAKISALWVKVADGENEFSNIALGGGATLSDLISRCKAAAIEVWGWHVPHCQNHAAVQSEVGRLKTIMTRFPLNGLIMDAEGGGDFFQGSAQDADDYGSGMRQLADDHGIPLGISSNDIPANLKGWLPRFNNVAKHATVNYPQVYYGGSPSVVNRLDRAVAGNRHIAAPFCPVGAAWLGDGGGCASASACGERATAFIQLAKQRDYPLYSFWHWGGAPLAFWDVLNTTPP